MRSWLTYIFLSMVACATVLTSCNNVLDEEGIAGCDDRTTVRLTISFGGDGGPMSRDVPNTSTPEDDDLDTSTKDQALMNDIYALIVKEDGTIKELVDLKLLSGPDLNDGFYTRTFEGKFLNTNEKIRVEVLANLDGNYINIGNNNTSIRDFISSYVGNKISSLYNVLVYNYDGSTPWSVIGDSPRGIPMWGKSEHIIPSSTQSPLELTCYLYRALAKVQIWVNMRNGIDGFVINSITVNNIHTKGYCVSQATTFDEDGPNYDLDGNGTYDVLPYALPSIPDNPGTQNVTYGSVDSPLNVIDASSDMIYLPEKKNEENDNVTITVNYTYNNENLTGTIHFKKDGIGDRFDIIRNHSYIFNISSVAKEVDAKLIYEVQDYYVDAKVEIPFK